MRVKTGTTRHRRHKKIRKAAKGFRGHRGRSIRGAKEGLMHAQKHAYIGRRLKKRNFRRLWIIRLSAGATEYGLSYSQLIHKLKEAHVELDRKTLSQIAMEDPKTFGKIINKLKTQKSKRKTTA